LSFPRGAEDGTEWKKNLEKWRAEPFLVYPLLYDPNETKWSESAAWSERSGEV